MLIIEGPDRVGKSRLCIAVRDAILERATKDDLSWMEHAVRYAASQPQYQIESDEGGRIMLPIMHLGLEAAGWKPRAYQHIASAAMIADRFHMSDLFYGMVCRGESGLSEDEYRIVDGVIHGVGGMIVVVLPRDAAVYDKCLAEANVEDELFDKETNRKVYLAYTSIVEAAKTPRIAWAPTVDRIVTVTANRTRKGVDWPSGLSTRVNEIADEYLERQRALRR